MIRGYLGATAFARSLRCHQGRQTLLSLREVSSLGFRKVDELFHGLLQDSVLEYDFLHFQELFRHLRHRSIKTMLRCHVGNVAMD